LVAGDCRKATVFGKYNIDFCCGGGKSLQEFDADTPLDAIVDHIVNVHHRYAKEKIPVITQMPDKVSLVHGERDPSLTGIAITFADWQKNC